MASVVPPQTPPTTVGDDGPLHRVHFRLWQIVMTGITILFTCWFFTFGAFPGIIALFIAKHVLVAILAVGLRLPPPGARPGSTSQG